MTNEARVGLFVFIVIVIFVVLSIKIGELSFNNKTTYPMSMVFSSVEGLKPGSNLELAGVVVGKLGTATVSMEELRAAALSEA